MFANHHSLSETGKRNPTELLRESTVHGANMGPIWGRQDPGGPHVGPMNFAIWDALCQGPHLLSAINKTCIEFN